MQRIEHQRQIAQAELAGSLLIAKVDGLQLLEDQREIADDDLSTQNASGFRTVENLLEERRGPAPLAIRLLRRREGASKARCQRVCPCLHTAAHEAREGFPRF